MSGASWGLINAIYESRRVSMNISHWSSFILCSVFLLDLITLTLLSNIYLLDIHILPENFLYTTHQGLSMSI